MTPTDYAELAPEYDQRYRDREYAGAEQTLVAQLEHVRGAIVEVGCGTGQWLRALSLRGAGYWPETYPRDLARYASTHQLSEHCQAAGLRLAEYGIAEQLDETRSARELLERGEQLKRSTSQLADLSPEEWEAGLARLRRACDEAAPDELSVRASLRLSFWVFER